jgi:hypothetical protein
VGSNFIDPFFGGFVLILSLLVIQDVDIRFHGCVFHLHHLQDINPCGRDDECQHVAMTVAGWIGMRSQDLEIVVVAVVIVVAFVVLSSVASLVVWLLMLVGCGVLRCCC